MDYDRALSLVNAVMYTIASLLILRLVVFHWRYTYGRATLLILLLVLAGVVYPIIPYALMYSKNTVPPEFTAVWLRPWVATLSILITGLCFVTHLYGAQRRKQDQFIANVSHELRTPLAIILGHSELQESGDWQTVNMSARRMAFLVDNILGVSRLEHINLLELERIDLVAVVSESIEGMKILAEVRGIEIKTNLAPVIVRGSHNYLVLAVNNIVNNAIKFNQDGGVVSVATFVVNGVGVVRVADTGIGISSEMGKRVYARFEQGDGSDTRRFSGVGLGLYFVKLVAEVHKGRIEYRSRPGKGTVFNLYLPTVTD